MRRTELKIKIKSLAEEARIIRHEERRQTGFARACRSRQGLEGAIVEHESLRDRLYRHRTVDVRVEARASHIAYAILRGRDLVTVEGTTRRTEPDWDRVVSIFSRFAEMDKTEAAKVVQDWIDTQPEPVQA